MNSNFKKFALPATAALAAGTLAVIGTLALTSTDTAAADEIDLSTTLPEGSVINAQEVLNDAQGLLESWSESQGVELAQEPASSLAFFIRSEDGYIESELAVGPVLMPNSSTGSWLALDMEFEDVSNGVSASVTEDAQFEVKDFSGSGTLFRPDGIQPSPASSVTGLLSELAIPREYWDLGAGTPSAEKVEVLEREELAGFDGPITTESVEFKDGSTGSVTIEDAYIVNSIRTPDGEVFNNLKGDKQRTILMEEGEAVIDEERTGEWVMLELAEGYPNLPYMGQTSMFIPGTSVQSGPFAQQSFDANPEDENVPQKRMFFVPRDENGELSLLSLVITTDAQNITQGGGICSATTFDGFGVVDDNAMSRTVINDTPEARQAWENIGGFPYDESAIY